MKYDLSHMSPYQVQELVAKDDDLRLTIAENMKDHGGSFVQALGECLIRADRNNRRLLAEAFMLYILEYQPNKWKKT